MFYINLVFVDAKKMRQLNKEYRHLDEPTTVLTFNYGEQANRTSEDGCLGEILLCLEEAKKKKLSVNKLLSHGIKRFLPQIQAAETSRTGSAPSPRRSNKDY